MVLETGITLVLVNAKGLRGAVHPDNTNSFSTILAEGLNKFS